MTIESVADIPPTPTLPPNEGEGWGGGVLRKRSMLGAGDVS